METAAERLIAQLYGRTDGRGPPGRALSPLLLSRPAPMLFLFDDESRLSLLEMRLVLFKLFSWRRGRRRHLTPAPAPLPSLLPYLDLSIYVASRQAC